jgi:hypothetical protein
MPRQPLLYDDLAIKLAINEESPMHHLLVQHTTIFGVISAVMLEDPLVRKINGLTSGHLLVWSKCTMQAYLRRLPLVEDPALPSF